MRGMAALAALIVGLAVGAGCTWLFTATSTTAPAYPYEEIQQLNERLLTEQAESDTLRGQLVIEQSTIKGLEVSLQQGQAEIGRLQEQLAFFEKLLPPGPQGSISIRAFDAEVVGHLLRYRLLLQRNAAGNNLFEGALSFTAQGMQDGKATTLTLQAATRIPDEADTVSPALNGDISVEGESSFQLSFEQFNRSAGWLAIPENFIPQSLSVHIQEGNTLRVSRKIDITPP